MLCVGARVKMGKNLHTQEVSKRGRIKGRVVKDILLDIGWMLKNTGAQGLRAEGKDVGR